jgi:hypothetical protein
VHEPICQPLFHWSRLAVMYGTPESPGSRWGPKIRRVVAKAYEGSRTIMERTASVFKPVSARRRMTENDGGGGGLRLPDVKPPCSNLAGILVPAIFFACATEFGGHAKAVDSR